MATPARPRRSSLAPRPSIADASQRARQPRTYQGVRDPHASRFVASCKVDGEGVHVATVRQEASFTIEVGEALRGDEGDGGTGGGGGGEGGACPALSQIGPFHICGPQPEEELQP